MYASKSLAAALLLLSSAHARPNLDRRQTDSGALEPWVTVDDNGTPKTITPVLTTVSGTPTVVSAAPLGVTGTVVTTYTSNGQTYTTTATASEATATDTKGAGAFPVCKATNTANPWCQPTQGATLNPGTSYYFTWDSTFFSKSPNTTLIIQGNYYNTTTNQVTTQAFASNTLQAAWGFWAYTVDSAVMQGSSSVNVSLQLVALSAGGKSSSMIAGSTVIVANPPGPQPPTYYPPSREALYIGLPTVLGFIIVVVVFLFIWNKRNRSIGLGNIMSRTRHGYGLSKGGLPRSGRRRQRKADERIQLMEREVEANGGEVYRDIPDAGHPRRDSDALGSLAGTPTEDRRMDFHRPGTRDGRDRPSDRNVFRDEVRRQEGEKF